MEAGGKPETPGQCARNAADGAFPPQRAPRHRPLSARDVQLYRVCEDLTEALIYFMVIFGPWAFGTTQVWSIRVMNAGGYAAGALLACKLAIRRFKDYHPPRWEAQTPASGNARPSRFPTPSRLTAALVILTFAILAYCLVSAVNARATFLPDQVSFAYRPANKWVKWLPHSLDAGRSWPAFWNYLGLACAFWAIRDWLLGKTDAEASAAHRKQAAAGDSLVPLLPGRLRRLLWLLIFNGGLLGVEGIVQRLEGSGRLLFLVKPHVNPAASTQFGPYAYRSNAAQYFNLLWPVCLGFWWTLTQSARSRHRAHHLILAACIIMAACPIISTTRAGAAVAVAIVVLAALFLAADSFVLAVRRPGEGKTRWGTLACLFLFLAGALGLGLGLGWRTLEPRLAQLGEGFELRQRMCDLARPMAKDYPLFGTGPGTFETVFQLYRVTTSTYWPAQLHNDWLETRITFGWVGSGLIALAFVVVLLRWFARGGMYGGRRFIVLIWLAMGGCLLHARYDFPFQIHSIVFLFLVLCAILFSLTRRP
jgi:hypothetical protein